jgi:hypothetical protein
LSLEYTYDLSKVRVIPQGVSGVSKTIAKDKSSERVGKAKPNYHRVAADTISRMQSDNAKEHKRIKPRALKKMMRESLLAGNPNISVAELDKLVDELLPVAMQAYKGPAALKPEISPEVQAVRDARQTERKRIVKLNKLRRKMDQPMSKEDREWVSRNRK